MVFAGVLTALGAEQLASDLNRRQEVREARRALDEELGWNLAALQLRDRQSACIDRHINELDRWAEGARSGEPIVKLARPVVGPAALSFRTAVWRATGDVVANMPLEQKLTYAQIYDNLENSETLRQRETARWESLGELQWTGASTPDRWGRIKGELQALGRLNASNKANSAVYLAPFLKLGVRPSLPAGVDIEPYIKAFCSPMLKE